MTEQPGPLTCGAFTAMPLATGGWRFTWDRLPAWRHEVGPVGRAQVRRLLIDLQVAHRSDPLPAPTGAQ